MEEIPSSYRQFGYMFVWILACLLLFQEGEGSELFIFTPLSTAIVLNGYYAHRFALEKWTFLAILAFVVAMVLNFFPIVAYFVIMEICMA